MKVRRRTVPLDMMVAESKGRIISVVTHGSKIIVSTRLETSDMVKRVESVTFSFDRLYDYINHHSDAMSMWSAIHT